LERLLEGILFQKLSLPNYFFLKRAKRLGAQPILFQNVRIPKKIRPIGRFIPKTFSSKNPLFTVAYLGRDAVFSVPNPSCRGNVT
jgi:hypothetical protein